MEVLHLSLNSAPHSRLFITTELLCHQKVHWILLWGHESNIYSKSTKTSLKPDTAKKQERKNKIMGQVNRWRVVSYRSQNIFLWKSVTDSLMKITLYSCANSATSIDNNLFFITKVPRSLFGLKITSLRPGWSGYLSQIMNDARSAFQ